MKETTRRWATVAFVVSILVATAGVGGAQVATLDSVPTAGSSADAAEPDDDGGSVAKAKDGAGNAAGKAKDKAENAAEKTKDKAENEAGKAKDEAQSKAGKTQSKAGKTQSKAGKAKDKAENGAGKAKGHGAGNPGATARVEREARANARNPSVGFRVRSASANETVSLRVGPPANASGAAGGNRTTGNATGEGPSAASNGMAVDRLDLRVNRGGDFTVNVTSGREAFETTPRFRRDDWTEPIGHIRVDHSVPDENITNASFTFRMSKERLAEVDTVPENVALYRYHDGTWNELETSIVNETSDGVVFRAESPGLSEFAAGAKRPKFELHGATVSVSKVIRGDSVYVNVDVSNVGAADGTFTADLILNDVVVDSEKLTIAAGGSRRVVFQRTFDNPGRYDVRINGNFAGTVVVEDRAAADTATETETGTETAESVDRSGLFDGFGVGSLVDFVDTVSRSLSGNR